MRQDQQKTCWWFTGPWTPPKTPKPREDKPVLKFNPACNHSRSSYDIAHCDECRRYSEARNGA